ncbi:MAG: hypothetical protein QM796_01760 [Chthoniobacteraceae bacterium]
MKRALFILSICLLLFIAYNLGSYFEGSQREYEDNRRWNQLIALDQALFAKITTRPSRLVTGDYVFEMIFPDTPVRTHTVSLTFVNGKFALPKSTLAKPSDMADTLEQHGSVVTWRYEGVLYEGDAMFVGIIDGNTIWGRVYGFNPEKESIGEWRIYPVQTK